MSSVRGVRETSWATDAAAGVGSEIIFGDACLK